MVENIFYVVLAILGLGFLVFIHELGHYIVAVKEGMRVEAFAIGFGKPIWTWEVNGVKWRLCMLPFGGYVKIAGMQKEKGVDPCDIPDGFYGKTPGQRIKVALAGPLVNVAFALIVFFGLWIVGGRQKNFAEFTQRIGWVDPHSALYENGVRAGDVIKKYEGKPFKGFRDLVVSSIMKDRITRIEGYKVDYSTGRHRFFDYTLSTYEDPSSVKDKMVTIGVMSPAQYLIYDQKHPSPVLKAAGLHPLDRIVWADGDLVFSLKQLSSIVNESTAFLTVQRKGLTIQTKVPRVLLNDLKMNSFERAEIGDWQHEANLKSRFQDLYFIPYNLSPDCEVESRIGFIDEQDQTKAFEGCERCTSFQVLQEGDRILAVDGIPVEFSYEILDLLQTRRVLMIVERDPTVINPVLWTKADTQFENLNYENLTEIISSIGTENDHTSAGNLYLLKPLIPQSLLDMPLSTVQKRQISDELDRSRKEIDSVQDPQKRRQLLDQWEQNQKKLVLGIPLRDRTVEYNPSPWEQFVHVCEDTWRTLSGLVTGVLNPKYVSGPVGIIQVVHHSWTIGLKEALFWMAVISLNLGIVNLLPIPVLDGGHIVFSLFEMATGRRITSRMMERLIVPFIVLLIGAFIYITYQDISRLFSRFF